MPVRLNLRTVIGVITAVIVGTSVANWWKRASYDSQVSGRVDATRRTLPHPVQDGVWQTKIGLRDRVIEGRYRVGGPTGDMLFDTDVQSTATFTKNIRDSICTTPDLMDLLAHGYSFDRIYEVFTPHGADTFHVVTTASDCPGVVVRK